MKQGKIYLYDQYVGLLTEDETGFTFAYDAIIWHRVKPKP